MIVNHMTNEIYYLITIFSSVNPITKQIKAVTQPKYDSKLIKISECLAKLTVESMAEHNPTVLK